MTVQGTTQTPSAVGEAFAQVSATYASAITDPNASATSHTYWLTAVDNNLAESEMAPPGGISP